MEILKKLPPTHTYFLMYRGTLTHKQFIKFTLMDLIFKGVLKITEVTKQASPRDAPRTSPYVDIGDNFESYTPLENEKPLIDSFKFKEGMRVLLRNFITVTKNNTLGFEKGIINSEIVSKYFTQNFLQKYFTKDFSITEQGIRFSMELKSLFDTINEKLPEYIEAKRLPEIVSQLGNNVILLESFDNNLAKLISEQLELVERNEEYDTYWDDTWWYYGDFGSGGYWGDFDYIDSTSSGGFDSTFDSIPDSSGWGDSGCGGCSSCGGCGGCGD